MLVEALPIQDTDQALGAHLQASVAERPPTRHRLEEAGKGQHRLLVEVGNGVDIRLHRLHAQQIEGTGFAHRLDAQLVRRGRQPHSVHRLLHAQLVGARHRGDDRQGLRPDLAARGVHLEDRLPVGRDEGLRYVHASLLDEELQIFARAQFDLVTMGVARRQLPLEDLPWRQARGLVGDRSPNVLAHAHAGQQRACKRAVRTHALQGVTRK